MEESRQWLMNQGRTVFSQLISFLPDRDFRRCVERYQGDLRLRGFTCWDQYLAMAFAHCAHRLIATARGLYVRDPMGVDLDESLYALDSTTIDLCLALFPWARFRRGKAAVKMHTLLDLRGNIPTFVRVTSGDVHDVNILDEILPEAGAFYVMDRCPTQKFDQNRNRFWRSPAKGHRRLGIVRDRSTLASGTGEPGTNRKLRSPLPVHAFPCTRMARSSRPA